MAKFFGISGSERDLISLARAKNLEVHSFDDIDRIENDSKKEVEIKRKEINNTVSLLLAEISTLKYKIENDEKTLSVEIDKKKIEFKELFNNKIELLTEQINIINIEIEKERKKIKENIKEEIEDLTIKIRSLTRVEFSLKNLFDYILASIKLFKKNKRLDFLLNKEEEEVEKRLMPVKQKLKNAIYERNDLNTNFYSMMENFPSKSEEIREIQKELRDNKETLRNIIYKKDSLLRNFDSLLKEKRFEPLKKIELINTLKVSNEFKGAVGEIAVINSLRDLSDVYYVFNDVNLEFRNNPIDFRNSLIYTAQLDHLVIGPTGIYIIETKNWSEGFTNRVFKENKYTPYDQITRNGHALFCYLNQEETKNPFWISYIIALTGAQLPPPKSRNIKVLRTWELSNYIKNYANIISKEEVEFLIGKFPKEKIS